MSGADGAFAHRAAGWNFHRLRRHADALREAQRALQDDPRDAEAHRLRALSLSMLKRHDEAMEALAAALAADPRSEWSHRLRALILVNAGQLAPALEAAQEAIRLAPDFAESHSIAAEVRLRLGKPAEALASARRALELDALHGASFIRAAHAAERMGRASEALEYARRAVGVDPQDADAQRALGVAAYRMGDRAAARTALREALRLDPTNEAARLDLLNSVRGRSPVFRVTIAFLRRTRGTVAVLTYVAGFGGCGIAFGIAEVFGAERLAWAFLIPPALLLLPLWILPLHDLLALCDPFGRLVLHRWEKVAALFTGVVLLVAAALGVACRRTGAPSWGWLAAGAVSYAAYANLLRHVRSRAAARRVVLYGLLLAGSLVGGWIAAVRIGFDAGSLVMIYPNLLIGSAIGRRWLLALPSVAAGGRTRSGR